jgi:MoaA/NifB/PqqE/SkfB family radical SAM enzyme
MYTYECNLICDHCEKNGLLSGEPMENPEGAKESVISYAEHEGWVFAENKWACPSCANQEGPQ